MLGYVNNKGYCNCSKKSSVVSTLQSQPYEGEPRCRDPLIVSVYEEPQCYRIWKPPDFSCLVSDDTSGTHFPAFPVSVVTCIQPPIFQARPLCGFALMGSDFVFSYNLQRRHSAIPILKWSWPVLRFSRCYCGPLLSGSLLYHCHVLRTNWSCYYERRGVLSYVRSYSFAFRQCTIHEMRVSNTLMHSDFSFPYLFSFIFSSSRNIYSWDSI